VQTVTEIPEFVHRGWCEIKGTGWLALLDPDRARARADLGLVGPVKIAGKLYECIAVERTLNTRPTLANVEGRRLSSQRPHFVRES
jgi:hypothetical protein